MNLSRYAPQILGIFRILAGAMFVCHGAQKLFGMFGGMPPGVEPWIRYGAGSIELVGGALLVLGLFTRPTAFICSGLMAVAYFYGHVYGTGSIIPKVNQGEPAVLYCWLFLYIAAQGPGAFAIDKK